MGEKSAEKKSNRKILTGSVVSDNKGLLWIDFGAEMTIYGIFFFFQAEDGIRDISV